MKKNDILEGRKTSQKNENREEKVIQKRNGRKKVKEGEKTK